MKNSKVISWVKRYFPAEILSVGTTFLAASLTYALTKSDFSTTIAATLGGNVGYFGYILIYDVMLSAKKCKMQNEKYTTKNLLQNMKALLLEFGAGELVDSLLIRPAMMYYIPMWMGDTNSGLFVAKICADIAFYSTAILSSTLNKKISANREQRSLVNQLTPCLS